MNKNVEFLFQLDTGSTVNILPMKEYIRARADKNFDKLNHTNVVLRMHNEAMEKPKGRVKFTLDHKGHSCQAEFLIAKGPVMLILSLASCERLQLVKIIDSDVHMITQTTMTANSLPAIVKTDKILSQFTDIFGGLGCLKEKYSLDIDTSIHPKVLPPCKVAVSLYNFLAAELHRMEDMKIMTPVSEATPWVSSVVVVPKKNGKVRVCLDP